MGPLDPCTHEISRNSQMNRKGRKLRRRFTDCSGFLFLQKRRVFLLISRKTAESSTYPSWEENRESFRIQRVGREMHVRYPAYE